MRRIFLAFVALIICSVASYAQVDDVSSKKTKKKKVDKVEVDDTNALKPNVTYVYDEDGNLVESADPIFDFEIETHNFGEVPEGDPVTTQFSFVNVGQSPLIIENIKASCGCTTPKWTKEPVLPGDKGTIDVSYKTKGRIGPFTKSIRITSNANEPMKVLYIKGKVLKSEKPAELMTTPVKKPSIVNETGNN